MVVVAADRLLVVANDDVVVVASDEVVVSRTVVVVVDVAASSPQAPRTSVETAWTARADRDLRIVPFIESDERRRIADWFQSGAVEVRLPPLD